MVHSYLNGKHYTHTYKIGTRYIILQVFNHGTTNCNTATGNWHLKNDYLPPNFSTKIKPEYIFFNHNDNKKNIYFEPFIFI